VESLGLSGEETVEVEGLDDRPAPGATVRVRIRRDSGEAAPDSAEAVLECRARLDSTVDVEYFAHCGVLPRVLRLKLGD